MVRGPSKWRTLGWQIIEEIRGCAARRRVPLRGPRG